MVKLSELIGEDKVNAALKNFLNHQQYPKKPTTINLLTELYKISPASKKEIDRLFKI